MSNYRSRSTRSTVNECSNFILKSSLLILCILLIIKPYTSASNFELLSSNLSIARRGKNFPNLSSSSELKCHKASSTYSSTSVNPSCYLSSKQIIFFIILLAGDVQSNPGPAPQMVYPCGFCERPVNWSTAGVCCDECDVWHHKSCLSLNSSEFIKLTNTSLSWNCFRCGHQNLNCFTYHSFCCDSDTSYISSSLQNSPSKILNSPGSKTLSPPLKSSTPTRPLVFPPLKPTHPHSDISNIDSSCSEPSSLIRPKETYGNIRVLNINCQGLRTKISEFKSLLLYTKPDIVCGNESWLAKDIKSSELFPDEYQVFRKDRIDGGGGGVFILVKKSDCFTT